MMRWIAHRTVPLICIALTIGAAVYSLVAPTSDPTLAPFAERSVVVQGVIVADPDVRDASIRLTVMPHTINGTAVGGSKRILVSADRFGTYAYGDRVEVRGVLRTPEAFETDSGRTFNYPKYLFAHGISFTISFAKVSVLLHGEGNPIIAFLFSLKHALLRGIERALPEPYAALGEGLLLGEKQSLGDRLYNAFRSAGVVHIIVLSGYNVSLIIESVLFVSLRVLPRVLGYAFAAVCMLAFTLITGASETTVRAGIMALLMMVARVMHRSTSALRGLAIAAAVMALINPFIVLYDLSFQLSILATLGLILFSETIAARITFVTERLGLREIVATTLATQVTVLPLLVLSVGAVSLVFLPANLLVLPAVPLAMFLTFIPTLVPGALAVPLAFPAYVVLAYIIAIPEFFSALPFALIDIPSEWTWGVLGMLALLYGAVAFRVLTKKIALK